MSGVATLDKILDGFGKRIYSLEQTVSTPGNFGATNEFEEIILDDGAGNVVIIIPQPPDTPENVSITPGAFYDVIYADIEWDPPSTGEEPGWYDIEIAKKVSGVYQTAMIERTSSTNFRIQPLEPNTTYGVRITAASLIGKFGDPTAWTDFGSGADSTVPPSITGLTVGRGATSVVVTFNESAAVDVAGGKGLYEVEIDTSNAFNTGNYQVLRTTQRVVAFNGISTEGSWYARVSAIDSSGNQGAKTTAGPATAGGVVDSMVVAGLSAAKITFGTMSGDRITTNTLDAVAIKTSSITSADITLNGGSFKAGSPPTTGLLINSQGLRLYASGVQTITLDAATGAASFAGNITGGTIQIGTRFSVDSSGNMTATNANFSGTITSSTITSSSLTTTYGGTESSSVFVGPGGISFRNSGNTNVNSITLAATGSSVIYVSGAFQTGGSIVGGSTIAASGQVSGTNWYDSGFSSSSMYGLSVRGGGIDAGSNINSSIGFSRGSVFTVSSGGAVSAVSVSTPSYYVTGGGLITWDSGLGVTKFNTGIWTTGTTYIYATSSGASPNVSMDGFGGIYRYSSSDKIKSAIKPLEAAGHDSAVILKATAKSWLSRCHPDDLGGPDDPNYKFAGFVAEELHKLSPWLVTYDLDGEPNGINLAAVIAMLQNEVKKLRKEVDVLKSAA